MMYGMKLPSADVIIITCSAARDKYVRFLLFSLSLSSKQQQQKKWKKNYRFFPLPAPFAIF